jgi:hypothetical protein
MCGDEKRDYWSSLGSSRVKPMVWLQSRRDRETKGKRNERKQKGNRGERRDTALIIFCPDTELLRSAKLE